MSSDTSRASCTSRTLFDVWRSYTEQEETKSDECTERKKHQPKSRCTCLVELREDLPNGRGLAVTNDVKPDDLVLTIPASMLINVKTIAKVFRRPRELLPSPRSSASQEAARLTSAQALSIFLCCLSTEHEQLQGQSVDVSTELSDLLAFHSSLPTSFATHPVMWCLHSDEGESTPAQPRLDHTDATSSQGAVYRALLAALPQQTLSVALGTTKKLKTDWQRCREVFISQPDLLPQISLPGPSSVAHHQPPTLSQFAHAWLCVQTRSVFYPLSLPLHEDNLTLAPLLDMANHTSHADCIATVSIRGAKTQQQLVRAGPGAATSLSPAVPGAGDIEIRAARPVGLSKGQELCIQYGARDDGRLLAEYGFHLSTSVSDAAQKAPWTGNPHASLSLDMYISAHLDEVRESERTSWREETLRDTGYWLDWSVEAFPEAAANWRTEVACRLLAIEDHNGNSERCAKKTRMDSTAPQPTHSLEADTEALRRFHLMLSGQIAMVSRQNEAESRRLLARFCTEAETDLTQRLSHLRESAASTSGGGDDAVAASVDLVTSLLVSQRQIARQMLYRLE